MKPKRVVARTWPTAKCIEFGKLDRMETVASTKVV